jgi:hypothetical protein
MKLESGVFFSELGSQAYKYSIAPSESSRQKLNVCLARTSFASSAWLRSILQRMISGQQRRKTPASCVLSAVVLLLRLY